MSLRELIQDHYLVSCLVAMVAGMLSFLFYKSSTGTVSQTTAAVGGIFINSLLTISLLLVYTSMAKTQEKQAELLELERKPLLEISDYWIDGDKIEIEISNYGGGLATDLELATVVDFEEGEKVEPDTVSTPTYRLNEDGERKNERSIKPHREKVRFETNPYISVHTDQSGSGFLLGTRTLTDAGIDRFWFQLYLRYSTRTGERYSIPIFLTPREVDVDGPISFEEAYSDGGLYSRENRMASLSDPILPLPEYRSK